MKLYFLELAYRNKGVACVLSTDFQQTNFDATLLNQLFSTRSWNNTREKFGLIINRGAKTNPTLVFEVDITLTVVHTLLWIFFFIWARNCDAEYSKQWKYELYKVKKKIHLCVEGGTKYKDGTQHCIFRKSCISFFFKSFQHGEVNISMKHSRRTRPVLIVFDHTCIRLAWNFSQKFRSMRLLQWQRKIVFS